MIDDIIYYSPQLFPACLMAVLIASSLYVGFKLNKRQSGRRWLK